ncbi:MAG TPA: ATP-binding protein [Gemmatimonadaceae bacterium]|jgi:predicted AAA+ superfamily ATPase|nr:ATP-binding protein [Gemmatimonadaceae bacterium]
MAVDIEAQLRGDNPWWYTADALTRDPHLKRYDAGPVRWDPPVMAVMSLQFEDTHTLRGPRQVGKTTTLKRLIRRLVDAGERRVLYFSFDTVRESGAIGNVIRLAKRLHPVPDGPWYIFLDEVTSVPAWEHDVKHCWDSGLTRDDALVLTASSARDLRVGTERLPGRRGRGRDFLQLPMSFRDWCFVQGVPLPDECVAVEEFLTPAGRRLAVDLYGLGETLERAFAVYRYSGGFPAAVRDVMTSEARTVDESTIQMLWHVLAGDLTRMRRDPLAGLKLLQQVTRSLGSPLKWTNAAEAMAVESPMTARDYAELLAETFTLLTVYYWDIGRQSLEPKKQRKVYVVDPLYAELPHLLIPGTSRPDDDGMVENLVAVALFRSAALTLMQANAVPGTVGYWRSSDDREIDFVVPRVTDLENPRRFPVEVKGDNTTGISHARLAIRRSFQQGVVISRSRFDWAPDVSVLPVWMVLAGLRDNMYRPLTLG